MSSQIIIVCQVFCLALILDLGCVGASVAAQDHPAKIQHPDEFRHKIQQYKNNSQFSKEFMPITSDTNETTDLSQADILRDASPSSESKPSIVMPAGIFAQYPESDYLMATGHGDLMQGALGCERVSDTVARMELAKQIRVLVKEHALDRMREQTGKSVEQDIDIVVEEFTSELLQDAKIVNRTVDNASGTCYSTAVMPKAQIAPKSISNFENSPVGQ